MEVRWREWWVVELLFGGMSEFRSSPLFFVLFFFFQAEDGIRDVAVTGVQTCALPIYHSSRIIDSGSACRGCTATGGPDTVASPGQTASRLPATNTDRASVARSTGWKIGRASCRERV